ncbi:twin-arginine translocase TatA/TatE family subunit [Acuticoccus sp. M5D2P5]|uniref:twin-arginine translocase TatA/TatE family subunit n=1 Tax=Acuticoccus kalidii TaxID=2910977 RepID=UPI001F45E2A1|nr:twin-arginine translocase TatA/TatE family subunit [Acuticoccus kalidii]MCF3933050.1 twin-arginine translocase TatA/TatE family subunit [Acuticoccus kalidii]
MGISVWQILIIGVILVLLFGRGKISELMGDVAKGINSFKKGLAEDDDSARNETARTIDHTPASTVNTKDAEKSRSA